MTSLLKPLILTSLALPTIYAIFTSTRLYTPPPSNLISSTTTIAPSFATSNTVTEIINPKGFRIWGDTRSITLRLPPSARGLSNEELLARFTRGFFGGWVFAPERFVLGSPIWSGRFVGFPQLVPESGAKQVREVWRKGDVSSEKLPEIGDVFFGAFQVVDKHLDPEKREGESYVDFGYGVSESRFVGVHRFSVERLGGGERGNEDAEPEIETETVRLALSCVTCNAKEDRELGPSWGWNFHRGYAMVLFREGVGEVVRSA